MKIILLAGTVILLSFTSCIEKNADENDSIHQGVSHSHGDGFTMMDGKMMMQQDGKMVVMYDDTVMTNGTQVMINGSCINNEGTKFTMKEGQHMDMTGQMMPKTDSNAKK